MQYCGMRAAGSLRSGLPLLRALVVDAGRWCWAFVAFFPFRDGLQAAIDAGTTAVIQPGGSIRDQEVIDAANEAGLAMVFTDERHFRH